MISWSLKRDQIIQLPTQQKTEICKTLQEKSKDKKYADRFRYYQMASWQLVVVVAPLLPNQVYFGHFLTQFGPCSFVLYFGMRHHF